MLGSVAVVCLRWFFLPSKPGKAVWGESGELVCTKPFPCQPTHFWNDENGSKYRKAYFSKFPGRLGADRAALSPTWAAPCGSNSGCAASPRCSHPPPKPEEAAPSSLCQWGDMNQYLVIFRLKPSYETITWV